MYVHAKSRFFSFLSPFALCTQRIGAVSMLRFVNVNPLHGIKWNGFALCGHLLFSLRLPLLYTMSVVNYIHWMRNKKLIKIISQPH